MQTPGGIHYYHAERAAPCPFKPTLADCYRVLARLGLLDFHAELASKGDQLVDSRRPLGIRRYEQGFPAVLLEHPRELAGGGGLAGALKAHHHHHRRPVRDELYAGNRLTHHRDQLVVNYLYDLLARGEALQHTRANRLHADGLDELLDNLEINVRFEQGHPYFAERFGYVRLGQEPPALQLFKYIFEFFGKTLKHP